MAPFRLFCAAALLLAIAASGCGPAREPGTPPPVAGTPPIARFTVLDGRVEVKAFGTLEWRAADARRGLGRGDTVRTAAGGSAEIRFFDGTLVRVRSDSLITVEESSEDPSTRSRRVAWHISSGEVNFESARRAPPGSSTVVSTPTIRATAAGDASAVIRVAESGESEVRMLRGASSVETSAGRTLEVGSGQALRVDATGQPGPARALPPAPRPLSPADAAEVAITDPARGSLRVEWAPSPGSARYHLQLHVEGAFARPLVDRGVVAGTSAELQGLAPGRYRWRVAGVAKDGAEGEFSSPVHFVLVLSAAPPRLAVALDRRGAVVELSGETDPGAQVSVDGSPIEVRPDGLFREFLAIPTGAAREVVVRATGANGRLTELRRTLPASAP